MLDAHRGELFAAEFVLTDDGHAVAEGPTRVVNIDRWLAELTPHSVVTGPGLERLLPRLSAGVDVIDRAYWAPTAAAVGRIGWRNFAAGERISAFDLVPQYFRQAAAEESRAGVRPG